MALDSKIDAKYKWLTFKGYSTGTIQDKEYKFLENLTGSTKTTNSNLFNKLGSLGYTGALNDRWEKYLRNCTGRKAIPDAEYAYYNTSFAMDTSVAGSVGGDAMANGAGTVIRGSDGTYVYQQTAYIKTATGDNARPQYCSTINKTGTLFERTSKNHMSYSEDFGNAYWTKTNVTLGSNVSEGPLSTGSVIADSVVNSGTALGNIAGTYVNGGSIAGVEWMFSMFIYGSSVSSNLELQIVGDTGGSSTTNITLSPGGWTRIDALGTSLTGTTVTCRLHLGQGTTITADKFCIFGAQLEYTATGSKWPTSYIKNETTTLNTRAFDYLKIGTTPTSKILNPNAGAIIMEFTPEWSTSLNGASSRPALFLYSNLAGNEYVRLWSEDSTLSVSLAVYSAAASNYVTSGIQLVKNRGYRVIARWNSTGTVTTSGGTDYLLDIQMQENSGSGWGAWGATRVWGASTANFTMAAVDNFCAFGRDTVFTSTSLDGTIHRAFIIPRAISLADCQTLLGGDS